MPIAKPMNARSQGIWPGADEYLSTCTWMKAPSLLRNLLHYAKNDPQGQWCRTDWAKETKALVRAVRLFLTKRLDVHWGTVKEV